MGAVLPSGGAARMATLIVIITVIVIGEWYRRRRRRLLEPPPPVMWDVAPVCEFRLYPHRVAEPPPQVHPRACRPRLYDWAQPFDWENDPELATRPSEDRLARPRSARRRASVA